MWTDHPETRKLFSPEREAVVRKKFEQMMPIIMSSVDDLSRLTHIIHRLGNAIGVWIFCSIYFINKPTYSLETFDLWSA
jgi:hypothetical protein